LGLVVLMVSLLAIFVFMPGKIFLAEDGVTKIRNVDSAKLAQWCVDIHVFK
jgi:hypothetical protein